MRNEFVRGKPLGMFRMMTFLAAMLIFTFATGARHEHPEKGPHKGYLIELGDKEYHAEFIHDAEQSTVTIYILDKAAKAAVPTEEKEIVIILMQKGKPRKFKLYGDPQSSDPKGLCSRFVSKGRMLCLLLADEKAEPRIQVTINGEPYAGKIVRN